MHDASIKVIPFCVKMQELLPTGAMRYHIAFSLITIA